MAGGALRLHLDDRALMFLFWSYFHFARNGGPIVLSNVARDGDGGRGKFTLLARRRVYVSGVHFYQNAGTSENRTLGQVVLFPFRALILGLGYLLGERCDQFILK